MRGSPYVLAVALVLPLTTALVTGEADAANVLDHFPGMGVPEDEVVVAIITTGITPDHPEFAGYRGDGVSADPQIVAWYDLGLHGVPPPGVYWDPITPVPFDPLGTGTATASLVGGATLGAAPGVKLAIAKVLGDAAYPVEVLAPAVEWAVKTAAADIVVFDVGFLTPAIHVVNMQLAEPDPLVCGCAYGFPEVFEEAWEAGVLPVFSVGHGASVPGSPGTRVKFPSWMRWPNDTPFGLSVAAAREDGTHVGPTQPQGAGLDPEVSAWGLGVRAAHRGGGTATYFGAVFASAIVGGMAASIMQRALDTGYAATPVRVEQLITQTAIDRPDVPFAIEGFGFVSDGRAGTVDTLSTALFYAASNNSPPPASLTDRVYHQVGETVRSVRSEQLGGYAIVTPSLALTSSKGEIGPSTPLVRDTEVYTVSLDAGDVVEVTISWSGPGDLDAYLYKPGAGALGIYNHADVRGQAAWDLNPDTLAYRTIHAGQHPLLVEGYLVGPQGQAYTLTVKVNGVPVVPSYHGDAQWIDPKPSCHPACMMVI